MHNKSKMVLLSALVAAASGSVHAASLEEVIVTARQSDELLSDVPVAVSVVSGESLRRYSATSLEKIVQEVPQVNIARGGSGSGASISIRGLGTPIDDAGLEQAVSVNLDGVQLSRGRITSAAMFDVQQVEILKGPQALFFGKNSPAGVISLTSKSPGDKLNGYITTGYEFEAKEKYLEGAMGGPVTDTLGARIAVRASTMEGWLKNTAQAIPNPSPALAAYPYPEPANTTLPQSDEKTARLTVEWAPLERLNLALKSLYSDYYDEDGSGQAQNICRPGIATVVANGIVDPFDDCKFNDRAAIASPPAGLATNFPGVSHNGTYLEQKASVTSLRAEYALDHMTLTSVSGYSTVKTGMFNTGTRSSIGDIWNSSPEDTKALTQELRLVSDFDSPLNFTVGGFFENNKRESRSIIRFGRFVPDPATGNLYTIDRVADVKSKTYSAFGQLRWSVADDVEIGAGARYTKEKKDVVLGYNYVSPGFLATGYRSPSNPLPADLDDSNWSPEATVTWHATPDIMIFAAYRTGYKSGGFSNPTLRTTTTADAITFGPEKSKGGEVGAKFTGLNGAFRGDLTVYRYKYDGLQVSSLNPVSLGFEVRNAAAAKVQGIEGSANFQVTERLLVRGAVGYNEARYESFKTAPCYVLQATGPGGCSGGVQDLSGESLLRAPDWSVNGGVTYDFPLTASMNLVLSTDAVYSSKYQTKSDNDPYVVQPEFIRVNASARVANTEGWEIALIGRNLENKHYLINTNTGVGTQAGVYQAFTPRGRELALQVGYKF